MSFTRFHDDPLRIQKQLQESSGPGRYILNVPGNGDKPCFMDDPYIRLQKWGGNLHTNFTNLESNLIGLSVNKQNKNNRDNINLNQYNSNYIDNKEIKYPNCNPFTLQSRVTNPAWLYRDLEQVNWNILPLNPQENICIPFQNNLNTRLLERDYFRSQK